MSWGASNPREVTHELEPDSEDLEVRVHAAALYVSMIKNGFFEEAAEFAEWFLDAFDHDLES